MSSIKSKIIKRDSISLETNYRIIKDVENETKRNDVLVKYNLKNHANITSILKSINKIISDYESSFNGKNSLG